MLKRRISILSTLMVLALCSHAQTMQDIFDHKAKITWLGLDFTAAKVIGGRELMGAPSDIQRLMASINDLMIREKDKYDVALAIDKIRAEDAIEVTKEHNASLNMSDVYSSDVKDHVRFRPEDIDAIVDTYDFKGHTGLGVMFIIESFNKLQEEGAMWVTFINMNTKEVFFTERMTGKPRGFGMRNYWATTIYEVMKRMEKKEFEMWRRKYYRK